MFQNGLIWKKYERPKLWDNKIRMPMNKILELTIKDPWI
jgi:hypothetical protein